LGFGSSLLIQSIIIIYYGKIHIRYITHLSFLTFFGTILTGYTGYITCLYGVDNIRIMPNIFLYTMSKWRYYIKLFAYQPVSPPLSRIEGDIISKRSQIKPNKLLQLLV
jgi:hypothetical protein